MASIWATEEVGGSDGRVVVGAKSVSSSASGLGVLTHIGGGKLLRKAQPIIRRITSSENSD